MDRALRNFQMEILTMESMNRANHLGMVSIIGQMVIATKAISFWVLDQVLVK
jgi:hypothetical protein